MKKKLLAFLGTVLVLGALAGCSNNASDAKESSSSSQAESSSEAKKEEKKGDGTVTFYIVRHGKTMLNTTDRVQGWSDAVLTPAGEEVVEQAGKGLKDIDFVAAYSSDSGRAMQTANIILEETGQTDLKLNTDWRLREFNFGTYEGDLNETMWTDIAESEGKTLEEWQSEGVSPENFANSVAKLDAAKNEEEGKNWPAEDYATIQARLQESMDEIAKEVSENGGGNVLVASHGLSISALLTTLDDSVEIPAGGLKNASVSLVEYKDGKFTVTSIGDMSFVEAGQK